VRFGASDEAHKRHSPVPAMIPGGIPDAAGEVKFIATPKKPVIDSLLVHVMLLNGLRAWDGSR
jgi:hypothetical protein